MRIPLIESSNWRIVNLPRRTLHRVTSIARSDRDREGGGKGETCSRDFVPRAQLSVRGL